MTPASVRCQSGKDSQRLIHLTLGITHASPAYILLAGESHRTNLRLNLAGNYTELLLRVSVTVRCTAKLPRGCLGAEGCTGSGKPLSRAAVLWANKPERHMTSAYTGSGEEHLPEERPPSIHSILQAPRFRRDDPSQ